MAFVLCIRVPIASPKSLLVFDFPDYFYRNREAADSDVAGRKWIPRFAKMRLFSKALWSLPYNAIAHCTDRNLRVITVALTPFLV